MRTAPVRFSCDGCGYLLPYHVTPGTCPTCRIRALLASPDGCQCARPMSDADLMGDHPLPNLPGYLQALLPQMRAAARRIAEPDGRGGYRPRRDWYARRVADLSAAHPHMTFPSYEGACEALNIPRGSD